MKTYQVCDYNFNIVGTVQAENAEDALRAAKQRWRFLIGLMVEEIHGC